MWLWIAVWPNLLANIIWTAPLLYVHYRKLKKHHKRLMDEVVERLRGDD